uniref:Uncharacterized protein n=1 Tax=Arundo donax TaxID=35708 RepID=A0A0A8YEZ4_ARUDO
MCGISYSRRRNKAVGVVDK